MSLMTAMILSCSWIFSKRPVYLPSYEGVAAVAVTAPCGLIRPPVTIPVTRCRVSGGAHSARMTSGWRAPLHQQPPRRRAGRASAVSLSASVPTPHRQRRRRSGVGVWVGKRRATHSRLYTLHGYLHHTGGTVAEMTYRCSEVWMWCSDSVSGYFCRRLTWNGALNGMDAFVFRLWLFVVGLDGDSLDG